MRLKIYRCGERCNLCGENIRRLRERHGLSQEQLAARMQLAGLPLQQKAISRIETGSRLVTDYELAAFAQVLDVSVEDLLD